MVNDISNIKIKLLTEQIDFLTQVNSQLSMWYNPYEILIASLSLLFTVGTIVTAVILFKNSKDHKESIRLEKEARTKEFEQIKQDFNSTITKLIEGWENEKKTLIDIFRKQTTDEIEKLNQEKKRHPEKSEEINKKIDALGAISGLASTGLMGGLPRCKMCDEILFTTDDYCLKHNPRFTHSTFSLFQTKLPQKR